VPTLLHTTHLAPPRPGAPTASELGGVWLRPGSGEKDWKELQDLLAPHVARYPRQATGACASPEQAAAIKSIKEEMLRLGSFHRVVQLVMLGLAHVQMLPGVCTYWLTPAYWGTYWRISQFAS
jgi:hypothetical protein